MTHSKLIGFLLALFGGLLFWLPAHAQIDPDSLLPAEEAFKPQVFNSQDGIGITFDVADGYYLYQSKLVFTTEPENQLGTPQLSVGKEKNDEFFGKQPVYYGSAQINIPYHTPFQADKPYKLTIGYQGCADVGICYPPTEVTVEVNNLGLVSQATNKGFNFNSGDTGGQSNSSPSPDLKKNPYTLSWDTLGTSLLVFFMAGLFLSFTACMYPLIPIVVGIILGNKQAKAKDAFILSLVYVQGLALTYSIIGVIAGLTGSLLQQQLQKPMVILPAAALIVVMAMGMFGLINIQLPNRLQAYFQNKSNQLSGGNIVSIFFMGMFSALIIGPCVAPPLAVALGFIASTGDGQLGGLALYALALGIGMPLIAIATFGAKILPKAGDWLNVVKYFLGCVLLATALYVAKPFLPYLIVVIAYALIFTVFGLYLAYFASKKSRWWLIIVGLAFIANSAYFVVQSIRHEMTWMHHALTLAPTEANNHRFTTKSQLETAMQEAFQQNPNEPVLVDFYADWCVSCKEMEMKTLNQDSVKTAINMDRFFTIDVTENTAEHQALLKEYGLFGPPGIFVVKANNQRSQPLLGFVPPQEFIKWYQSETNTQ